MSKLTESVKHKKDFPKDVFGRGYMPGDVMLFAPSQRGGGFSFWVVKDIEYVRTTDYTGTYAICYGFVINSGC